MPRSIQDVGAWAVPVGAFVGRPLGMLVAVGVSVAIGLRLPPRLSWRELVVIAFAASCIFTFGLFFATAVFPMGPVLIEAKVGALSTIAGVLLATSAAWLLSAGRFERRDCERLFEIRPHRNRDARSVPLIPA